MKKIICGIATMNTRKDSLTRVLRCLNNQTVKPDEIYVYNNDENEFNATDNGKFYYFDINKELKEDVYFFSLDDDIYYPTNYIETTIQAIDKYKCIVSYHGRHLNRLDVPYYSGHISYSCLNHVTYEGQIDVCGTGVTAFDTSYFKADNIFNSEYKRMSDLVFSLEATRQNKKMVILKHKQNWIKDICTDIKNSCHFNESKDQTNQIDHANKIIRLKNKKVSIIIPYNKDRGYLEQAVKSINNQTYRNVEIIYSRSDKGVSYNLNEGIKQATGDYIKYLCDDDMLTPNSIADSVQSMFGYDFIHGNAINFWDTGKEQIYTPDILHPTLNDMLKVNRIHGGTLMYSKHIFDKYGYFDESLWTGEEYEFNLRLLNQDASLGYCDSFLYLYRRHEQQKSLGNKDITYQNARQKEIEKIKNKYRK